MRILFVIPTLVRHGAEKQLSTLAPALAREGFDVHVCALTSGGPYEATLRSAGIPVTVINKAWKFDPIAYRRLKSRIVSLKPDIVQTFLFAANSYGRVAALAAGVPRIFASERCVDPWKQWHELIVDRYLAKRSEAIVVNNRGVQEFYNRRGIPNDKFRIIPNGIGPMAPSHTTREALLKELGLPVGTRLIGAVNRLWPQKRVKDLIWAADLLKVVRDDVHLLVIGDGPHRARLQRFRDQVQIRDRVHLLGARDDVARMMPHFDCFWLASEYEGMSNSIMEAMACGVPVVASDIPGNRDLVIHGETGYLFPVGARADIARHTNRLLDDAALSKRLGVAGQQRVLGEFSLERMVAGYRDLYRGSLSSTSHR
jgi:glycosyltransferase involved in cell wall biosynthesis